MARCKVRAAAASNAKFPFAQNSRFKPKREKCLKGNLKPKTGKMPKREFKKLKREFMPKGNLKS